MKMEKYKLKTQGSAKVKKMEEVEGQESKESDKGKMKSEK